MGVLGVGQGIYIVVGVSCCMQVDEGWVVVGQGEVIGYVDYCVFVQVEDVVEIFGEVFEEWQFVGVGVVEDGGQVVVMEDFVRCGMDGFYVGF